MARLIEYKSASWSERMEYFIFVHASQERELKQIWIKDFLTKIKECVCQS